MIVCICHAVSDAQVRQLVLAGAREDDVVRLTSAGSSCGHCAEAVRELVTASASGRPPCGKAVPCAGCECVRAAHGDPTREAA